RVRIVALRLVMSRSVSAETRGLESGTTFAT
ncbi:MAG: hypothetical protein ACI92S_001287, partial [Planctomycetaceae bacterium]